MTSAPCKGCEERHVACHSGCGRYQEYLKVHAREKKQIRAEHDKFKPLPKEVRQKLNKQAKSKMLG